MHNTKYGQYLAPCCKIAQGAGALIMPHFVRDVAVTIKDDKTPVTAADIEANEYIVKQLHRLTPDIPVIAEESVSNRWDGKSPFWLVDPLDGTRSFIAGHAEFTVNIALIEDGAPVLGVIYSPSTHELYYGVPGAGSFSVKSGGAPSPLQVRTPPKEGIVITKSRSKPSEATKSYMASLEDVKEIRESGSSIKFCHIAEGSADIYPRFGVTMEWDTAAGHAILKAAGGKVITITGEELQYGKSDFTNPAFFAFGQSTPKRRSAVIPTPAQR